MTLWSTKQVRWSEVLNCELLNSLTVGGTWQVLKVGCIILSWIVQCRLSFFVFNDKWPIPVPPSPLTVLVRSLLILWFKPQGVKEFPYGTYSPVLNTPLFLLTNHMQVAIDKVTVQPNRCFYQRRRGAGVTSCHHLLFLFVFGPGGSDAPLVPWRPQGSIIEFSCRTKLVWKMVSGGLMFWAPCSLEKWVFKMLWNDVFWVFERRDEKAGRVVSTVCRFSRRLAWEAGSVRQHHWYWLQSSLCMLKSKCWIPQYPYPRPVVGLSPFTAFQLGAFPIMHMWTQKVSHQPVRKAQSRKCFVFLLSASSKVVNWLLIFWIEIFIVNQTCGTSAFQSRSRVCACSIARLYLQNTCLTERNNDLSACTRAANWPVTESDAVSQCSSVISLGEKNRNCLLHPAALSLTLLPLLYYACFSSLFKLGY